MRGLAIGRNGISERRCRLEVRGVREARASPWGGWIRCARRGEFVVRRVEWPERLPGVRRLRRRVEDRIPEPRRIVARGGECHAGRRRDRATRRRGERPGRHRRRRPGETPARRRNPGRCPGNSRRRRSRHGAPRNRRRSRRRSQLRASGQSRPVQRGPGVLRQPCHAGELVRGARIVRVERVPRVFDRGGLWGLVAPLLRADVPRPRRDERSPSEVHGRGALRLVRSVVQRQSPGRRDDLPIPASGHGHRPSMQPRRRLHVGLGPGARWGVLQLQRRPGVVVLERHRGPGRHAPPLPRLSSSRFGPISASAVLAGREVRLRAANGELDPIRLEERRASTPPSGFDRLKWA